MSQHRRDAHKGATAPKPQRKQKGQGAAAPVAKGLKVVQEVSDSATARGVDRIFHEEDISTYASGQTLCNIPINAGSFSRMSVLAKAYQRVEFLSLVFKIATYAPSSTGGGYVAAFVADPDDEPPTEAKASLNWLTSQQGSVTTKWWQNAEVQARPYRSWFYTSPGVEIREYSPGSFFLVVDTKASVACGLTVWAHWKVRLSRATLESSITGRTYSAGKDLYTQAGHKGLFYKEGTAWKDDIVSQIPGVSVGDVFSFKPPLVVNGGETQAAAVLRLAWYIKATTSEDLLFCYEKPDQPTSDVAGSELLVIPAGTTLVLYKSAASGEVQGPRRQMSSGARTAAILNERRRASRASMATSLPLPTSCAGDSQLTQVLQRLQDTLASMALLPSMASQRHSPQQALGLLNIEQPRRSRQIDEGLSEARALSPSASREAGSSSDSS
nr:MAG: RNA-dependent RNA polymerase [Riboviria sp.]